ncbi:MAG: DUF2796 domain-containing protein [Hyphomicrobiaceae bacterium]|nr:DUF2796 domain-containing protein [Hyphomicrobiaceae bacterium]
MKLLSATCIGTLIALTVTITGATAAEEGHKEHGAHQHGHGTFEMAIEKGVVSIDLRAPGSDIVGFEHPAVSEADKKAIADAKARLADPIGLFGIPKDAGCRVDTVDVHTHGADGDEDGEKAHKEDKATAKAEEAHSHKHSSFHAKYTLTCRTPQAIKSLDFAFFKAFPGAQELEVVAVSDKGQVKAEATRKTPKVALPALW